MVIRCPQHLNFYQLLTFSQQICAALAPLVWDESHQAQMRHHFLHPKNHVLTHFQLLTNLSYLF